MDKGIGFIGYGEAGSAIAGGLAGQGAGVVRAYDIALEDPSRRGELEARAKSAGVKLCFDLKALAAGSRILMSAVTGDVALDVARAASPFIGLNHVYMDLNSVSPENKKRIAEIVEVTGARFVEAAVMTNVPKFEHRVPMLLCGKAALEVIKELTPLGMDLENFGVEIGRASATKMFRSLVVKGTEALLLECVLASSRYGVTDHVLDYVTRGYGDLDWRALANNLLTRTALHGTRRAHELAEVAETLDGLGIEPLMARAGAARLGRAAAAGLEVRFRDQPPKNYAEVVEALESSDADNDWR